MERPTLVLIKGDRENAYTPNPQSAFGCVPLLRPQGEKDQGRPALRVIHGIRAIPSAAKTG